MKKCASCTKDLPDAALHCVFCGAKQAPTPAAQPGMAKTVMGYGGNEELNKLREQAAAQNAARSNSPSSSPVAPSMPLAAPQPAPTPYAAARPHSASQPPPAAGYGQGNLAPVAGAQARTMFVESGPPPGARPGPAPSSPMGGNLGGNQGPTLAAPAPSYPQPSGPQGGYNPQPQGGYNPQPQGGYTPPSGPQGYNPQPIPSASPPYMAPSHNANQAARPIEPWKDTLRTMMFIWGGVLIACFAVPISLSPLGGWWNLVIDGEGTAKLMPLILAAVGILSVVVGAIPMASGARGIIAAVLALSGIFVPMFIAGAMPPWMTLVSSGGLVLLVPALIMRNEYTESPLPRILVTVGALAALVPFVVPQGGGGPPIVDLFKFLIDAPGTLKVMIGLILAYVVVIVLTLLAWLPSPSTAGAKALAWVIMLFPLIAHAAGIILSGGDGIDFEHKLNPTILGWAYGAGGGEGGPVGMMGLGTAYMVIASYGLASVIGKKLE